MLQPGDTFKLDGKLDLYEGTKEVVGFAYKDLLKDVSPNDTLLIDDGRIVLEIVSIEGQCDYHQSHVVGWRSFQLQRD